MTIVAIIAVDARFPSFLWQKCLKDTARYADRMFIRMDHAGPDTQAHLQEIPNVAQVIPAKGEWDPSGWREELVRLLDAVHPDLVLTPDHDEIFESDDFEHELKDFWDSDKKGMMFEYRAPMPTDDGRTVIGGKAYPSLRHMLAWKWIPGITYRPYQGLARPTQYADESCYWMARTKVAHYSMYTRELEAAKHGFVKKWWGGTY